MAARIIDGKAIAREIQAEIKDRVRDFRQKTDITPKLAAVLVGEDAASQVYVRNKQRGCKRVGIKSELHQLPVDSTSQQLLKLIHGLNHDPTVHGILVQLPLPPGIDEKSILDSIDPRKDVDAFHPHNVGLLSQGRPRFLPCTPHGIVQLLDRSNVEVAGKNVVVIGRSDIVGKPIAMMLQQKKLPGLKAANATVTVCHSRTQNLAEITRTADILIAAIGKPNFVSAEMVKPGATVIDVGINRVQDRLVGDVDFEAVGPIAGTITPVPGGVGPLTVTMLLENTLSAAKIQSAD